ncbi:MAG: hypothetical protein ACRDHX_12895 [Chloroflexota bacterium]
MKALVSAIVALLALAMGAVHLALDFVLFHGHIFTAPAPPPGLRRAGPPPGSRPTPLPVPFIGHSLPQLFLANFVAAVVLVVLFLLALRLAYGYRLTVDILLVAFSAATLIGWNNLHGPNPQGLGHVAVGLEITLIVFAVIHAAISAPLRAPLQAVR